MPPQKLVFVLHFLLVLHLVSASSSAFIGIRSTSGTSSVGMPGQDDDGECGIYLNIVHLRVPHCCVKESVFLLM
jgi:hypothetical protein